MNYLITTSEDSASNHIAAWLHYYKVPFVRINTDTEDAMRISHSLQLSTNADSDIGTVYLRKLGIPPAGEAVTTADKSIRAAMIREYFQAYIKPLLHQARQPVNSYQSVTQLNKYATLLAARSCGLRIPETLITNSKQTLLAFMCRQQLDTVITKPAGDICSFTMGGHIYKTYVRRLQKEDIDQLPDPFFPSLFQEAIPNLLDIKTVYCFGQFYTAAFLQTGNVKDDFRSNYEHLKTLNYELPAAVERQLQQLLHQLELSVCTVDFVLSPDGRLYFLEVNPSGQFGAISAACNYFIEKKIAQQFLKYAC